MSSRFGVFYRDGRGGLPKDDREAALLFKLAADQGNAAEQVRREVFRGRAPERRLPAPPQRMAGQRAHALDLRREYFSSISGFTPESALAVEKPERSGGILAGNRAPDAPVHGAAGQPTRLFKLFQGPHWTLLGYRVDQAAAVAARPNLPIHAVGPNGDIRDEEGHIGAAYGLEPGDWVLVRPDGYVGAIISSEHLKTMEPYKSLGVCQSAESASVGGGAATTGYRRHLRGAEIGDCRVRFIFGITSGERKRGQCQHPGCACGTYSPLTDKPRLVNKYAGKLLYRKRSLLAENQNGMKPSQAA
jgi:hypothetical protein